MKFFVVALALFAVVAADVSELPSNEYLPPVSQEYIPPAAVEAEPAHTFGPEGYSYKVPEALKRRYRYRVRRDVSELGIPSNEYLPPVEQGIVPIAEPEPAHVLTEQGYAYNNPIEARRRYRIRRRRDVSELATPSNEYLPPTQEYLPPVQAEVEPAHILTEEGYSYNNPIEARRRYRIRRRRDVSELAFPSNEYLPPVEQGISPIAEPEPAHVLTEQGYAYNNPIEARRRYRIRRRRDVSELATPSNEYLPPTQEYIPPVQAEVEPAHVLTEEGYSYNNPIEARRRYRIRRRRDVSELAFPSNEYLPPVEQGIAPIAEPEPAHVLTEQGYAYNNPIEARRRYRIRRRRDVSELATPSNEYLPPTQEYLPPVQAEVEPAHVLTEEGYSYNNPIEARRRYRIRRRRDVSELAFPSNEYLPPVEQGIAPIAEPEPAHVLTEQGYAYNNPIEARRRYRIRRRRDVSELVTPSNEYLPPTQEYLPPVQAEVEPAHVLTEEGYAYKNPVEAKRRYRYRYRH